MIVISKHKYNYWNHLIRKKQKPTKEMAFAEITPIVSKTESAAAVNLGKSDEFQIVYKNIQVTIPGNFNQKSSAGLMKVLQEL